MKEINVTHPISALNANNSTPSRRYMPGLDGLRALSVIAVVAYHLNLTWAPGGFIASAERTAPVRHIIMSLPR